MGTRLTGNEIPTSPPPPPPPWIELSGDVTANILQRLGAEEILESAQKVCTTWWKLCKDPAMWHIVVLKRPYDDGRDFDLMCRCAVDRSQGQLTTLVITGFGDDELLNYVADRSSHLRQLMLAKPFDISETGLSEAVKKLPQLEELHLIKIFSLGAKYVETIGISCPLLKLFTYGEQWEPGQYDENGIALAIAKTMPNLHYLRLVEDGTRNEGLEAILDGCPHLETLDLSYCYGLHLTGALEERCSKQIKFLRLPIEPSSDDDFDEQLNSRDVDGEYDYDLSDNYYYDNYY